MDANYYQLRQYDVNIDTTLDGDLDFTGENFFTRLKSYDLVTGQATFINPPRTSEQQVDIPKDELVSKEYVDSVDINGGKNFYLNYSQTDPVYTVYKTLSPTVDVTPQQSISVLALGTNLLAQFISPSINVSRLQAGLFTLNQFGSRTGNQGFIQFYFRLYLFSTNTLVGQSRPSNNVSNSLDLFTMVFNLTSNIEVATTERLVLKLYSAGVFTNNSNVTAFFENGEYSFLTTTLNRASDLLKTDNEWTGQNYFENPPNDPKEVATTDMVGFSMTDSSNTWTNTNIFLTKPPQTSSTLVATTSYCDNVAMTIYSTNNSWGAHLFTNETNSSTQLATCKYVQSNAYIPSRNNTFTGINTFPIPTPNSQEPASTQYVNTKFFDGFRSQDNNFTGTNTWTKATPSTTDIATTKYMVNRFLNELTFGTNVKCQTVTTSGTTLANTSSSRTIIDNLKATFLAGNNALDNQNFLTQVSTDTSTRIATTAYVQSINFNSFLSSINNWTGEQNFLTQTAGTSNTRIATTAFCDTMTFSMNNNTITGNHTVPTAPTILSGDQIANLDYTIANKPNLAPFLTSTNTWSGVWNTLTAPSGTNTKQMASTAFMRAVMYVDLLTQNNTWSPLSEMVLPAITGTTDVSTRGATIKCIPAYIQKYVPLTNNVPAINFTNIVLTPSQIFSNALQVANTSYVISGVDGAFLNAGNESGGIEFTVNQRCPTRLTASTFLANTTFVAGKVSQYFTTAIRSNFRSTVHTWLEDNTFSYALSTLDNSTLGATCSYVNENFFKANTYSGQTTLETQPRVGGTYPSTVGQLGYTQNFTVIKFAANLAVGFNTLIDFGTIPTGNYLFTVREAVLVSGNTATLNVMNYFWGPSIAVAEQNFSQFTGSGAWITTPNILTHGIRLQTGTTTFHRSFIVPFVNASTLVHSVRLTGTISGIANIQSHVSITRLF